MCIVCGCSLRESGVYKFGKVAEKGCLIRQEAERGLNVFGHRRVTGNKSYHRESSGIVLQSLPNVPVYPGQNRSDCWIRDNCENALFS